MLVRNTYTGALHDVPDQELYEVVEPALDGFGNPLGWSWSDIGKGLQKIQSAVAPIVGVVNPAAGLALQTAAPIASNILSALNRPTAARPGMAPAALPVAPAPGFAPPAPGYMPPPMPWMPAAPAAARPPWPTGWVPASAAMTNRAPRRLYLRCSAWPGPPGLVPAADAAAPLTSAPVAPAPVLRRVRRHYRPHHR